MYKIVHICLIIILGVICVFDIKRKKIPVYMLIILAAAGIISNFTVGEFDIEKRIIAMLPGMPGEELLTLIRKKCDIPVIVITAKDELDDKIDIFAKGADDYITKPFEIKEVIARIQVQLRHKNKDMVSDLITYGKLRLDRKAHRIYISDEAVDCITKQEFSILELLMEHPKQVFSKEDIFEYAWDEPYMGETKTLDVHISNIRKKLKKITETEYIETVWGIGYKLKE